MPEIDELIRAYIAEIQTTITRSSQLDAAQFILRADPLFVKRQKGGKYPKEVTYQVIAEVVTYDGHKLQIHQDDYATRTIPFRINASQYRCFDPNGRCCWRLETPGPDIAERHFQKVDHQYIRITDIDIQRLTSLDVIEIFIRFCEDGTTLERFREGDLHARSWEKYPQG